VRCFPAVATNGGLSWVSVNVPQYRVPGDTAPAAVQLRSGERQSLFCQVVQGPRGVLQVRAENEAAGHGLQSARGHRRRK
jgi:hypothetical protein